MEGELAAIGDGPAEDDGEEDGAEGVEGLSVLGKEEVEAQVGERYEKYVEARGALVREVKAAARAREEDGAAPGTPAGGAGTGRPERKPARKQQQQQPSPPAPSLSARDLIAFLPTIIQSSRDEAALLQQTAFLRRQLNLAAAETDRTVRRLAGESHLVPPDASDMAAWGAASQEFAERTHAFVEEQVRAGSDSVKSAREALAGLEAKRAAVEHLKTSMGGN